MAKAKLDASWNEASGIAEVVPDAIMYHDVVRVAFGDEQIDGVSKLQLPALAWLDAAKGVKNRAIR